MSAPELALRLALDLAAMAVLAGWIFRRRHGRGDLMLTYCLFNVGLFAALVVIGTGGFGVGAGFGLFALLSIIRLRSEPFTNTEIAYFFLALVIALVAGVDAGSVPLVAALLLVALGAAFALDRPSVLRPSRQLEVTLDHVAVPSTELDAELARRLGIDVRRAEVLAVDYVQETTRIAVSCPDPAGAR